MLARAAAHPTARAPARDLAGLLWGGGISQAISVVGGGTVPAVQRTYDGQLVSTLTGFAAITDTANYESPGTITSAVIQTQNGGVGAWETRAGSYALQRDQAVRSLVTDDQGAQLITVLETAVEYATATIPNGDGTVEYDYNDILPDSYVLPDLIQTIAGTEYTTTGVTVGDIKAGPISVTGSPWITHDGVGPDPDVGDTITAFAGYFNGTGSLTLGLSFKVDGVEEATSATDTVSYVVAPGDEGMPTLCDIAATDDNGTLNIQTDTLTVAAGAGVTITEPTVFAVVTQEGGGAFSFAAPVGHAAGQEALICIACRATDATPTPAGWTNIGNVTGGGTSDFAKLAFFHRTYASASETAADFPDNWSRAAGAMIVMGKGSATGFVIDLVGTGDSGTGTTVTITGTTPAEQPGLGLLFSTDRSDATSQNGGTFVNAGQTITNRASEFSFVGAGSQLRAASFPYAAGATGNTTQTMGVSANWSGALVTAYGTG